MNWGHMFPRNDVSTVHCTHHDSSFTYISWKSAKLEGVRCPAILQFTTYHQKKNNACRRVWNVAPATIWRRAWIWIWFPQVGVKRCEKLKVTFKVPITDPWDERYIYLLIYHTKSTIHVGKYTIPMDIPWMLWGKICRIKSYWDG